LWRAAHTSATVAFDAKCCRRFTILETSERDTFTWRAATETAPMGSNVRLSVVAPGVLEMVMP
jgi:hypothetical protein